jgi:hypothetical protein
MTLVIIKFHSKIHGPYNLPTLLQHSNIWVTEEIISILINCDLYVTVQKVYWPTKLSPPAIPPFYEFRTRETISETS